MTRRPDTADEILRLRAELRRRYRVRETATGSVRREIDGAPPARGENRKNTLRKLKTLNAHLAERKWFYRLVDIATKQYLANGRIDPRIVVMGAWCKAAHEAKYPGWVVTDPPPVSRNEVQRRSGHITRTGDGQYVLAGPIVDRLNESLIGNPLTPEERQIVEAAKERVKVRLGRRAHAAALASRTTSKRSASRRAEALALLKAGKTQQQVAEKLGLDERTIRRYQRGQ